LPQQLTAYTDFDNSQFALELMGQHFELRQALGQRQFDNMVGLIESNQT
jgi:hypothetical protein